MNRLRETRHAEGLTQEELAERVATTANSIWRLESGHTKLTQHWMLRLGKALGCDRRN
jgi:transcriptional regulator with XRE-family HTH domain